jgi:hypothetical protein
VSGFKQYVAGFIVSGDKESAGFHGVAEFGKIVENFRIRSQLDNE